MPYYLVGKSSLLFFFFLVFFGPLGENSEEKVIKFASPLI